MADRSHLSIGEVLSLLRDEFPDVTISKIRFLESQGLVDPERTPSGYRKFYEHDVERLRWILRQQRENFLPLKVIRGRLSEQGTGAELPDEPSADDPPLAAGEKVSSGPQPGPGAHVGSGTHVGSGAQPGAGSPVGPGAQPGSGSRSAAGTVEPSGPARNAGPARNPGPARPPATPSLFAGLHSHQNLPPGAPAPSAGPPAAPVPAPGPTGDAEPAPVAAPSERPAPQPAPVAAAVVPSAQPAPVAAGRGGGGEDNDTYSAEELAAAAGAELSLVTDLKQYGLIAPHAVVAGTAYYDAGAVAITRAAADFSRHGVEARHLRIWRNAADREADLFQQVVLPLLRQRNPQARRQAAETLGVLARAGGELRAALVERALREIR